MYAATICFTAIFRQSYRPFNVIMVSAVVVVVSLVALQMLIGIPFGCAFGVSLHGSLHGSLHSSCCPNLVISGLV